MSSTYSRKQVYAHESNYLLSLWMHCDINASGDVNERKNLLISADARQNLGLAGTLGGSIGAEELNVSDPDSDIRDELQVIPSNSDQEIDDCVYITALPPVIPLPLPQGSITTPPVVHTDVELQDAEIFSEDDMKKSFQVDFTSEPLKLNESGGSHRLGFIEQLENTFRTPAAID